MSEPSLLILDVGHGNAAVAREKGAVTVIDAASGPATVSELLVALGVDRIDQIILSHADADHCGGLIGLLMDPGIGVGTVWVNRDNAKDTDRWEAVRRAVLDARQRGETKIKAFTGDSEPNGPHQRITVEILAPDQELTLMGPGQTDQQGRSITTNTMSAVVRILIDGQPIALLAGDIDETALDHLLTDGQQVSAPVLVFPHHGGAPGTADVGGFVSRLCEAVDPSTVVFSNGRGRFDLPRADLVASLQQVKPTAHVMCTQLSRLCAHMLPQDVPPHLNGHPARGRNDRACCGGTIEVSLSEGVVHLSPQPGDHAEFVQIAAATAVCRPPE